MPGNCCEWREWHGGDADLLAGRIEEFLKIDNEIRKKMGLVGRKHIEDNFSREIVVEAYKEVPLSFYIMIGLT